MDNRSSVRADLYPAIEPYDAGMLPLDDVHTMYWETSGNPHGVPVVFLHGGPGGGCSPEHRRFFDPNFFRIVLFDQRAFLAAANVTAEAKTRVSRADRRRELAVLEQLAKAFDAWDRFDHKASKTCLEDVAKSANDLRAVLGSAKGQRVLEAVERSRSYLEELCQAAPPSRHHVLDLLANAKRRKDEGRVDDAVARLYRAIEAVAQVALKERYG
ncbi:MAG: hypothetical protein K6U12_10830, partial [Armatimonadetes bacterium]|nr:hypothetical protein [Armatimonadota bacterium]